MTSSPDAERPFCWSDEQLAYLDSLPNWTAVGRDGSAWLARQSDGKPMPPQSWTLWNNGFEGDIREGQILAQRLGEGTVITLWFDSVEAAVAFVTMEVSNGAS